MLACYDVMKIAKVKKIGVKKGLEKLKKKWRWSSKFI